MDTDNDIITITEAEYVEAYIIRLVFSDGIEQTIDFKPFLDKARNPMTTKYRSLEEFRTFTPVNGNLSWNDYEMCFSLESLHKGRI
jgi:hypothetical protein